MTLKPLIVFDVGEICEDDEDFKIVAAFNPTPDRDMGKLR